MIYLIKTQTYEKFERISKEILELFGEKIINYEAWVSIINDSKLAGYCLKEYWDNYEEDTAIKLEIKKDWYYMTSSRSKWYIEYDMNVIIVNDTENLELEINKNKLKCL